MEAGSRHETWGHTINATKQNVKDEIFKITSGRGVDHAAITAGLPSTLVETLKFTAKRGIINIFAETSAGTKTETEPNILHYNEIFLTGTEDYTYEMYQRAFKFIITRRIEVKKLITHRYKLEEIYDTIKTWERKEESLKIILLP